MTIRHIALIQFKPSISKQEVHQIMKKFSELKKDIPQIMSFSWGENNSPQNLDQGYLYGFVMEFKNDIDRRKYLEHPAHIKLSQELIHSALQKDPMPVVVFDYEL